MHESSVHPASAVNADFGERLRGLPLERLVEEIRADQARHWRAGDRIPAEAYLASFPALAQSREDALVIIVGEMLLRAECGPPADLAEFQARFPHLADVLATAHALNRAMSPSASVPGASEPSLTCDYEGPASSRAQPLPSTSPGANAAGSSETGEWIKEESEHDPSQVVPAVPPEERRQEVPFPRVPGYEVLTRIGFGAMGVVYKAKHLRLKRIVALKMIRTSMAGPHALERFRREAESIARLQHPNIVQVFEVGDHAGDQFLSLEYVEGGSLHDKLKRETQNPREAALLVETMARAMHYAHERGVVHRDLKPGNVLLTSANVPKITDFGLAKQLDDASGLTHQGLGTPSYMAPEQASDRFGPMNAVTDVYGLGAVLYESLTGKPPFKGHDVPETVLQVLTDEVVPPSRLQPRIPRDLETICLQCLKKEQRHRYPTAMALADDLRRFINGEPVQARPVSGPERLWRWCRRNPKVAALISAVMVLLTTIAATSTAFAFMLKAERDATDAQRQVAVKNEKTAIEMMNEAIDVVYRQVTGTYTELRDAPSGLSNPVLDKVLKRADTDLERLLQLADARFAATPALALRTRAGILQRMGDIFLEANQPDQAEKFFQRSHYVVQELAAKFPRDPLARRALGVSYFKLGNLARRKGDIDQARENYSKSMDARRERLALEPNHPDAMAQMAIGCGTLGELALAGDVALAKKLFTEALSWRDQAADVEPENPIVRRERAGLYDNLGKACQALGDKKSAFDYFDKARLLRDELLKVEPTDAALQSELANSWDSLGGLLIHNEPGPAREHFRHSVALREAASLANPHNVQMRRQLSNSYYYLATAYLLLGETSEADSHYVKCLEIRESLAKAAPQSALEQMNFMIALPRCGRHEEASKLADRFLNSPRSDAFRLMQAACCYALCLGALKHPSAIPSPGEQLTELAEAYATKAMSGLRKAIEKGWRDADALGNDPDLAPLRDHPGYAEQVRALIHEVQGRSTPG